MRKVILLSVAITAALIPTVSNADSRVRALGAGIVAAVVAGAIANTARANQSKRSREGTARRTSGSSSSGNASSGSNPARTFSDTMGRASRRSTSCAAANGGFGGGYAQCNSGGY